MANAADIAWASLTDDQAVEQAERLAHQLLGRLPTVPLFVLIEVLAGELGLEVIDRRDDETLDRIAGERLHADQQRLSGDLDEG